MEGRAKATAKAGGRGRGRGPGQEATSLARLDSELAPDSVSRESPESKRRPPHLGISETTQGANPLALSPRGWLYEHVFEKCLY